MRVQLQFYVFILNLKMIDDLDKNYDLLNHSQDSIKKLDLENEKKKNVDSNDLVFSTLNRSDLLEEKKSENKSIYHDSESKNNENQDLLVNQNESLEFNNKLQNKSSISFKPKKLSSKIALFKKVFDNVKINENKISLDNDEKKSKHFGINKKLNSNQMEFAKSLEKVVLNTPGLKTNFKETGKNLNNDLESDNESEKRKSFSDNEDNNNIVPSSSQVYRRIKGPKKNKLSFDTNSKTNFDIVIKKMWNISL